jgi:hypothetical protein
MGSPVMTDERIIAYMVGQLQGLVGSAQPMTARRIKRQLRDLLDWIEAASTRGTVEAVLAEAGGGMSAERSAPAARRSAASRGASDDELDKPAEEWLIEAFRQGFLMVQGVGEAQCREWSRVCTSNEVPSIVVRVGDSELAPASVSLDGLAASRHDPAMWGRAVDLFRGAAAKTASGDVYVIEALYALPPTVAEAEALAKALVGLIVAQRRNAEERTNEGAAP